jgi:hypothetical protein
MFPRLVIALLFPVSCVLKGQRFASAEEVTAKTADRGTEKWFPGMLPKALRTLDKESLPKGTTLKKMFN